MKIVELNTKPVGQIAFLNAERRPNQFYQDTLDVYHGRLAHLPDSLDAVVVTADLQGRELPGTQKHSPPDGLRLLGEIMPDLLVEYLEAVGVTSNANVAAILAGDFYTYPDLRGRGGTGDVTAVWQAFADAYQWVVGVAGNHDTFGDRSKPFTRTNAMFLDGQRKEIAGWKFAGMSGVIGNTKKNYRRTHEDFLVTLDDLITPPTDVLVMHDGPSGRLAGCRGIEEALDIVETRCPSMVIRGHCHWPTPWVEVQNGVQILNVDQTVVVLTR